MSANPTGLSITTVTDTSMSFIWNDRSTYRSSFEVCMASRWWSMAKRDRCSQLDYSMTYTVTGLTPLAPYEFHVPRMRRARAVDLVEHGDGTAKRIPAARIRHGHGPREQQPQ